MNDNVMPHRANIINQNLDAETIKKTGRFSKSLDLNTIKHVWNVLQRNVQHYDSVPSKTNNPEVSLLYKWDRILRKTFHSFNRRFPKAMQGCNSRKGATKRIDICWIHCRILIKQIMQLLDMENWKFTLIGMVSVILQFVPLSK